MIVHSSAIGMQASRSFRSVRAIHAQGVSGVVGSGQAGLGTLFGQSAGKKAAGKGGNAGANLRELSAHMQNTSGGMRVAGRGDEKETARSFKQQCMEFLMELLFRFRGERGGAGYAVDRAAGMLYQVNGYQMQRYRMEEEHTAFSVQGTVNTADGRELTFQLNVGMSRRFEEYYTENVVTSIREFRDPLVINLNGNVAQVSDQTFFFDLDCDGSKEKISKLQAGSGFLALDLNGDGAINDGSELFGTKSGDGFRDLARYDADKNGWIDEADPIWEKLLIWTKDEDGKDQLYRLADRGVGAICLSQAGTQFSLTDQKTGAASAMIRKTGIFLYENGAVSTLQHLDMAVYDATG